MSRTCRIAFVLAAALAAAAPCRPGPGAPAEDELELFFKKKTKSLTPQERREIEETIQKLETTHPEDRQKARERIVEYGPRVTPFLVREVRSPNHNRARSALVALGLLKDPDSVPFLLQDLRRPRFLVSSFAALALGKIDRGVAPQGMRDARAGLAAVLLDRSGRDAFDRAAAGIALARLGPGPGCDPEALVRLVTTENDAKVLAAALMALGRLAPTGAYESIATRAASSAERVARAAVLALGDLGDERAVPLLLARIRSDESQKNLQFACGAVSRFDRPEVRTVLLGFLERSDIAKESRAVALRALGSQTPGPGIRRVLLHYLRDPRAPSMVRAAAAASIHPYQGDEEVRKGVVSLLREEDPGLRAAAAVLLAHFGDASSAPRILRLLDATDRGVVEASALALAVLLGPGARGPIGAVPATSPARPFADNILAGYDRPDWKAYFRSWLESWIEGLGGQSVGLRRNLANEQLYHLFELEGRLLAPRGGRRVPVGERGRPRARVLSTAQQDLRLWIEQEPYF